MKGVPQTGGQGYAAPGGNGKMQVPKSCLAAGFSKDGGDFARKRRILLIGLRVVCERGICGNLKWSACGETQSDIRDDEQIASTPLSLPLRGTESSSRQSEYTFSYPWGRIPLFQGSFFLHPFGVKWRHAKKAEPDSGGLATSPRSAVFIQRPPAAQSCPGCR